MNDININKLLGNYLKGKASPLEQDLVENWLLTPDHETSVWEQMSEIDQKKWLETVFKRIEHTVSAEKTVKFHPQRKWWKGMVAMAAIVTAFLIAFNIWFAESLVHVKMSKDAKQQITLNDGSRVWINSGSELKYNESFNGNTREVYLTGEAYFNIKRDSKRPFIVHTGSLSTTVLGTAFNIKTDVAQNQVRVTVTKGKVKVSNGEKILGLLLPNQQIIYNSNNQTYQQLQVDATQSINWLPADLFFDNATFGDVTKKLEQRFNVKIEFANNQLKNCRFSGTAIANKEIEEVLEVMCKFNNANYTRYKNTITIFGAGCN